MRLIFTLALALLLLSGSVFGATWIVSEASNVPIYRDTTGTDTYYTPTGSNTFVNNKFTFLHVIYDGDTTATVTITVQKTSSIFGLFGTVTFTDLIIPIDNDTGDQLDAIFTIPTGVYNTSGGYATIIVTGDSLNVRCLPIRLKP